MDCEVLPVGTSALYETCSFEELKMANKDYKDELIEALAWLESEHMGMAKKFCEDNGLESAIFEAALKRFYKEAVE